MNIWKLSLLVSMLIILVSLVRICGRKLLNKKVIVFLWNLVLLRAFIPVQIPIEKLPFANSKVDDMLVKKDILKEYLLNLSGTWDTTMQNTSSYRTGNIEEYLLAVWLAGAVVTCLILVKRSISEIHSMREIMPVKCEPVERLIEQAGLRRKVKIYTGRNFKTPVTSGFIHPKIILPEDFEKVEELHIRNMILHELQHIRSFDVPKRFCMSVAVCLHWFNPLVWISAKLYKEDQEMACDERVLRFMNHREAREYAATLISMSSRKENGSVLFEGFQKRNAERERILAAIENRKMGVGGMAAAMLLIVVSMVSFAQYVPTAEEIPVQSVKEENTKEAERNKAATKETEVVQDMEKTAGNREEWLEKVAHYKAIWEDIIENVNDPNAPLSEEQRIAYNYYLEMGLVDMYLEKLDQGIGLKEKVMDMIERIYPDRHYMTKN